MSNRIKWSDPVTGLDGVIAVAQALKDGKPVQSLYEQGWMDPSLEDAFNPGATYRIGEEVKPREFWVNDYGEHCTFFPTREEADYSADECRVECIHVREVIE